MTTELETRWATQRLVGARRHRLIVRLRPGRMHRAYQDCFRIDNGVGILVPLIWQGQNHHPWQGLWEPLGPWMELPQVESEKHARDVDPKTGGSKGTSTATVVMSNIGILATEGVLGSYRRFARGYFSPTRGIVAAGRPNEWPDDIATPWTNVLDSGWQIEVWEGYGTKAECTLLSAPVDNSYAPANGTLKRTWTGVVVKTDSDTQPDKITLICQDFSIFLTDQRPIGDNKSPDVRSPVTFADRKQAQGEKKIVSPLDVSDGTVTFTDPDWEWQSAAYGDFGHSPYIELTLPAGFYSDFFLASSYDHENVYVSLWMNGAGGVMDSTHPQPAGWVDLGLGSTPVIGDSVPYIREMSDVASHPSQRWGLGHGFDVPAGSKLRLTFANLTRGFDGNYYAGTRAFAAYRYGDGTGSYPKAGKGWILVEDAVDVVRLILIWAGFKEWNLEAFGWTLFMPRMYGGDKSFMDIISDMLQQGNFIFWMGGPTNDDRSIGVPHFVRSTATDAPPSDMLTFRDSDFIQRMQVDRDNSDLPYVMRYRGAFSKNGQQALALGTAGAALRYMATYYPPWAGSDYIRLGDYVYSSPTQIRRTAAVLRHFTETMGDTIVASLNSNEECMLACVLAAFQYGIVMWTAQFQIAGRTGLDLNQQIEVFERSQAINSRMWITSIESEHTLGPKGKWVMTISGSLIDSPEMDSIASDYNYWLSLAQARRAG